MRFIEFVPKAVSKSMMPKGVEHRWRFASIMYAFTVSKSMMPKGVEHYFAGNNRPAQKLCRNQ